MTSYSFLFQRKKKTTFILDYIRTISALEFLFKLFSSNCFILQNIIAIGILSNMSFCLVHWNENPTPTD